MCPGEINLEIQEGVLTEDFEFISEDVLPSNILEDIFYGNPCACVDECELDDCTCVSGSCLPALFDRSCRLNRFLPVALGIDFDEPVPLCSSRCNCSSGVCPFQPARESPGMSLILKHAADKGLGVFCVKDRIPTGTFIDFYVGEIISARERRQRLLIYDKKQKGHALLCLKEHKPSPDNDDDASTNCITTCRDATAKGNISRFINHDCSGGNLIMITCRYHGSLISKLGIIASRDIQPGEELTMKYGPPNACPNAPPCHCRSKECLGYMPHEN